MFFECKLYQTFYYVIGLRDEDKFIGLAFSNKRFTIFKQNYIELSYCILTGIIIPIKQL
jgi:hypothetical protein